MKSEFIEPFKEKKTIFVIVLTLLYVIVSFPFFDFLEKTNREFEAKKRNREVVARLNEGWKTFSNKSGGYTISYPHMLLFQRNDWIGDNIELYSSFHMVSDLRTNTYSPSVNISINPHIERYKDNYKKGEVFYSGSPTGVVSVIHRKINFKNGIADEYSYVTDSEMKVSTFFYLESIPFAASISYPEQVNNWRVVYEKMWKSIKLISK